ncbi:HAMP domain-containing histidine kinase [Candidatus Poribacteria bacterium]|nr:HAMP domain-containing histidine kinase [Candidatus Poribacteria bacterium]
MKLHIQAKATLTIALLVVLVLTASSYFFYDAASRALDAEMGERLVAIAKTSAAQLNAQYVSALQPGSENTRIYPILQKKLQLMRDASEAQEIYVFDLSGRSLVDSREAVPIGSRYRSLDADRIHIEQVKQGKAAASVAFHGQNDAFYKSAYAPVRDDQENVVAILAVDASVLFLETLEQMRRNMVLIGVVGIIFAVVLSILFARSIVIPIKKLSSAAQQIKVGDFGAQVETHSKDEVGALAETFNEMSIAIKERDHRLSRLAEELRQMSAGLAHEVRNPLNGMRIFLGLLKRQIAEDPKAEQLIQQVDGEVQSLNQLVTEFLDFARPTPLQRGAVNLSGVVDSVTALLFAELQENAVEIQTIDLDKLPTIEADVEQLKWVFTNLIKNAVQAMPKGEKLVIEGAAVPSENVVHIKVCDTGIGMSPDVAERAFDPFFTTKDTGTGLGLAIVKRLIENHRGTIECQTEEGRGTTFVISLPIKVEEKNEPDTHRR